jgi:hypothetical protein
LDGGLSCIAREFINEIDKARESASHQLVVDDDLLGGKPCDAASQSLRPSGRLCANPNVAMIGIQIDNSVDWLHRRVRQQGYVIDRIDAAVMMAEGC